MSILRCSECSHRLAKPVAVSEFSAKHTTKRSTEISYLVASLRLAPDLAFGAGKRACAGRDVALEVAAAAVDVAARHRGP